MNACKTVLCALALTTSLFLAGCGSGGSGSAPSIPVQTARQGTLSLKIVWPASASRSRQQGVPAQTQSIRIEILQPSTGAELVPATILPAPAAGGTSTSQIDGIPSGPVRVKATAYPDINAAQSPIGVAQVDTTVQPGIVTPVTLNFNTTATQLTVDPTTLNLTTGSSSSSAADVTASVLDMNSQPVSLPVVWVSSNSIIASVQPSATDSTHATVTGLHAGTAVIEARQPDTGLTAQATVTVTAGVSPGAGGLQAGSPWPMFRAGLLHTGRGLGSGAIGVQKWKFTTGDIAESSPAIGTDGTVYAGSADHNLYAVNPDGTMKWKFTTGGAVASSPAIGADGTVYVGSQDRNLYAINPDGSMKWKFTTGNVINRSSPAIGTDGTVYVGSQDRNLYAVNTDGSMKWKFTTASLVESSPAIGTDGTLYVGSDDGNLYAVNTDGSMKWKFTTGGLVESSPAIGTDGTVYIGSEDNNLYAVNPDGTMKWKFTTSDIVESSPAIGTDGTVYVGSDDVNLYAIK